MLLYSASEWGMPGVALMALMHRAQFRSARHRSTPPQPANAVVVVVVVLASDDDDDDVVVEST
jgi:hypothetical protein